MEVLDPMQTLKKQEKLIQELKQVNLSNSLHKIKYDEYIQDGQ